LAGDLADLEAVAVESADLGPAFGIKHDGRPPAARGPGRGDRCRR
jgi:hypothetical protein